MLKQTAAQVEDSGRRLLTRSGVGVTASIVQASLLDFPHLSVDRPGILVVRRGRKHLSTRGKALVLDPGMIAVFGGSETFDVRNEPDGTEPYRAEAVFPDPALLTGLAVAGTQPAPGIAIIENLAAGFGDALQSAIEAIADQSLPEAVARHRVGELLIWIESAGLSLAAQGDASLVQRIRRLVSADPAADWPSARIATEMAMSEATLRRRLADKGTSLSAILLDVRMSIALALLQSTDDPVGRIAMNVGYDSPSRFAARFRERFGFQPSLVRDIEV